MLELGGTKTYDTPESTLNSTCITHVSKKTKDHTEKESTRHCFSWVWGFRCGQANQLRSSWNMYKIRAHPAFINEKVLTEGESGCDKDTTNTLESVGESPRILPQMTTDVMIIFTTTWATPTDTDAEKEWVKSPYITTE